MGMRVAAVWISNQKNVGAENLWMAILLAPIKIDRLQDQPKPER